MATIHYLSRAPLTLGKALVLSVIVWGAFGNAFASSNSLNIGVESCDAISDTLPPASRSYAITGKVPHGFNPAHSRAWYATALGLTETLGKILDKHPDLVNNMTLLQTATFTKYSDSLRVFLTHGANPNAYVNLKSASGPLIQMAAHCGRVVNMLYLLQAGANVYAKRRFANSSGWVNAMAELVMGSPGPFPKGIVLFLAAGYDPRCPVIYAHHKELTALFLAENNVKGLKSDGYNASAARKGLTTSKGLRKKAIWASIEYADKVRMVAALLKGATAIAKARSPGPPLCGSAGKPSQESVPSGGD